MIIGRIGGYCQKRKIEATRPCPEAHHHDQTQKLKKPPPLLRVEKVEYPAVERSHFGVISDWAGKTPAVMRRAVARSGPFFCEKRLWGKFSRSKAVFPLRQQCCRWVRCWRGSGVRTRPYAGKNIVKRHRIPDMHVERMTD